MTRHHEDDGDPYVVIERPSSDLAPFLVGVALGAGLALLIAPRSGAETRAAIRRRARTARDAAQGAADRVTSGIAGARQELERRIERARAAVTARTRQLADAVATGRAAAREAEAEVRGRLVEGRRPPTGTERAARRPPVTDIGAARETRGTRGATRPGSVGGHGRGGPPPDVAPGTTEG